MTYATFNPTGNRARRAARGALSTLFVALLIVAQALAVAHRSDAARHATGVFDAAAFGQQLAQPRAGAAGELVGELAGEQAARDSASCELCHVAGKLPALAFSLLSAAGASLPAHAPRPAVSGLAASAPQRSGALPRAPPRARIETR